MKTVLLCGWLFTGLKATDRIIDHSTRFVMPGLSDMRP